MTGFVLLRVRAHRLLLGAALLAVILTTTVLAALTGFSGSIGNAALQAGLRDRSAAAATLTVSGQIPADHRAAAEQAVTDAARRAFDGLPVTVRRLESSGSYALPRSLQPPAAREGDPDLARFAALDRTRLTLVDGAWPRAGRPGGVLEAALPQEAAKRLRTGTGAVLELTDQLAEKTLRVRITGVYAPADLTDPYWLLDDAGGRGVRTVSFTTYGPLLADPSVLASGAVAAGDTSWLGSADFSGLDTGGIAPLREAMTRETQRLTADTTTFGTTINAVSGLPTVLAQTERALAVSRSTLLIVAVQLVMLAAYALLLVARLLSTERSGETALLRARGGSRRRIAGLAAVEALLLALPAAVVAPLLSGPLTRLFAERSALSTLGVRLDTSPSATVWLVSVAVALACAAAVVAPALGARDGDAVSLRKARGGTLPWPVRAGADIALLLVAGIALWQLQRTPEAAADDAGIDPVLVAAPALALLAGTVLTLRLLPPAARLAERRAAAGRGLSAALAGWQFSRRPLRGAGPVLLLVLAVAMGMLAIGQSNSWERSQHDQADFRAGAPVRVLGVGPGDPERAARLAAVPGVREVAPAHRSTMDLAGHTAAVLAVATDRLADGMLLREDLADGSAARLLAPLASPVERGQDHLLPAVASEAFMAAAKAEPGDHLELSLDGRRLYVVVGRVVEDLPTTGTGGRTTDAAAATHVPQDGGGVLVDLTAVNRYLATTDPATPVAPTEWWLTPEPGRADDVAKALRERADAEPGEIVVRDEIAAELLGDPLGAGPHTALMAAAAAAAALAAVGFAVGSAGSVRERSAEFAILRALGAPRRRLARLLAAEQGLLIAVGLLVGLALGALLARVVVPLVVLTGRATRPVPPVLVELPLGEVALLLAGVAVLPLAVVAAIALRRNDPAVSLRHQGDN
ncbi:FtsX-like permease family protein [Streptomyces sp. NPDC085529]|uniref:FtsX-like permease family protein n=1 Tax=Streptomyces sp. NPDC085529 TaxID=3365729 RepID=UPI0037D98692